MLRGLGQQYAPALNALTTVRAALTWGVAQLAQTNSESPRLDAEVLLRHVLGWARPAFFVGLDASLSVADAASYATLIAQRATGTPVAYLTGSREFLGLPFAVGPGVLVPRPETELLIEWVAAQAQTTVHWQHPLIVDVGTGSGAIALGLATLLPQAQVIGIERSAQALRYARINRAALALEQRVSLVQGDLLAAVRAADIIVANLPYLRDEQWHPGIAQEPAEALFAGVDGLDLYRGLLGQAPQVIQSPGLLALECDPTNAATLAALCGAAFPTAVITTHRDLAGHDRFVSVER